MNQAIDACRLSFLEKISDDYTLAALLELKSSFVGKSGVLTELFKSVATLSIEEKKVFGLQINELKVFIEEKILQKMQSIKIEAINEKFRASEIDITIPAFENKIGKLHPVTQTIDEIIKIFYKYGFDLRFDREIETNFYNFDALNFAPLHPARGMHDSFFVKIPNETEGDYLLRTHTSSVQIRSMFNQQPPFCFLSPGRTYRCDMDRTHTPMFNQIEGVLVEQNVSFANLKWIIEQFLTEFFAGMDITVRFRPSFFPFTEPSAEVDIGINVGGEIKYLEVLGCGVIHPNVLQNCNIDTSKYTGLAFGLGVERFAMLKHSINDLRDFFENKKWWINHYGF